MITVDAEYSRSLLVPREQDSHKGSFGTALIIGGCRRMLGAPSIAAMGALHSGAGLVRIAFPDCIYPSVTAFVPETTYIPLPSNSQGMLELDSVNTLEAAINNADSVAVGCGMGVCSDTVKLTQYLIETVKGVLILDADALNCLSKSPDILKKRRGNTILTPHPGEMSRLCKRDTEYINSHRTEIVREFAAEYGVTLLLKGHNTVISDEKAESFINTTGNSGLAKGGSGDLLTGIIAAFAASGAYTPVNAAILGAYIHGLAADMGAERYTEYSLSPSLCAEYIGKAIKEVACSGT